LLGALLLPGKRIKHSRLPSQGNNAIQGITDFRNKKGKLITHKTLASSQQLN
jgi:hypothetical protein